MGKERQKNLPVMIAFSILFIVGIILVWTAGYRFLSSVLCCVWLLVICLGAGALRFGYLDLLMLVSGVSVGVGLIFRRPTPIPKVSAGELYFGFTTVLIWIAVVRYMGRKESVSLVKRQCILGLTYGVATAVWWAALLLAEM